MTIVTALINSLSSSLACDQSCSNEVATWCNVSIFYWRLTLPGTVNKRCQLLPAMVVFSVFSSLRAAAIVCAWNIITTWGKCRQTIVSYLRYTPIQRRRSHSGKTQRRHNRELRIRYNNFSQKQNVYVLKDFNFINSNTLKATLLKKYVQLYILSNIPNTFRR